MKRLALAILCVALLGASDDRSTAMRYFLGTWKCGATTLTFASFADTSAWMRASYGGTQPDGTAVVGYVTGLHAWVFRDFHRDGAYADLASPGPNDGRWQWSGPYYPVEDGPPLQDRMTYQQVSPTRFDRTFELLQGTEYVPTGSDTCTKVTA